MSWSPPASDFVQSSTWSPPAGDFEPVAPPEQSMFQQFGDMARNADPTQLIKQAAPSNLLRSAGVASVNAPDATRAAVNMIPGIGDPSQVLPFLQRLRSDPGQLSRAAGRMGFVQNGGQPNASEALPAAVGTMAGSVIEAAAQPTLNTAGIMKAEGPLAAGFVDPSTALPGAFEKAGEALGKAKTAARAGESVQDATRFRGMLQTPSGVRKLAEEAKAALDAGKDLPITHLLAYKEALGKAQAMGGMFAGDYKAAADAAKAALATKAPELVNATSKMALNYLAKGDGLNKIPWLTLAVNPEVGAAKMALTAPAKNYAGALAGLGFKNIPKAGSIYRGAMGFLRAKGLPVSE